MPEWKLRLSYFYVAPKNLKTSLTPLEQPPTPPPCPMPENYHKLQQRRRSNYLRPPSRAMSPEEQFETIRTHHEWEKRVAGTPTESDFQASYFIHF